MIWLALGYFLAYIPYALLVKALSSDLVPGMAAPGHGLVLLPAAALGQLAVMPVFLGLTGLWRHSRRRVVLGRHLPVPGRNTLLGSLFTALVVGTTTLNFTFTGASVLFALLLMRAGVLVLSPVLDAARRRRVSASAWAALLFSLLAIATALGDVTSYRLTGALVVSVAVYLIGYAGRFEVMSREAKTGVPAVDRRYFAEEHAATPVLLVLLLAAGALLGQEQLREGFTTFLATPTAAGAFCAGVAYEVLFVFGTLIYLDRREFTWCVPANRCASLLSGLVVSYVLARLTSLAAPGPAQLVALAFVFCAIAALSAPALLPRRPAGPGAGVRPDVLLFVCGGNTCRSAMAEVFARAQLAAAGAVHALRVTSAGVCVGRPGAPLSAAARRVLGELGLHPRTHRARPVTARLCRDSSVIYCMTQAQCEAVTTMAPEAVGRVHRLDVTGDVPDPSGQSLEAHRQCARRIQGLVRARLNERFGPGLLAAGGG
ncbi:hypothetical protein [Streptomyces sp. NPDC053048]|uniref:arsenate reductase/protein-tyrosine-phosphatase family protein n=1 Tax=Streptomyces sp. NPDC053048 TaxID=3365694 RepID=UPI0037D3F1EF